MVGLARRFVTYVLVLTFSYVDYRSVTTFEMPETQAMPPPLNEARREFEREYLVRILRITQGNVTRAARLAGRNRTEFYRLLERNSLSPAMFKVSRRGVTTAAGATTEPAAPV